MEIRNQLVDTYFRALDEEDYTSIESAFTEDVTYRLPEETITNLDDAMEYFRNRRRPTNTTHEITRRIHDDETSAVEGYVTGEMPDRGEFEGRFADIFEFDPETERISELVVYPIPW